MPRLKITTTLDEELLLKAKEVVSAQGLDGVNTVIEKALRLYFANCTTVVWEKHLSGGWVKKLVVRDGKVTFESIRSRKILSRFNPMYYSDEALQGKGFRQVWKLKAPVRA